MPLVPLTLVLFAACTRGGGQDRGVRTSLSGATVEGPAQQPPPAKTTDAAGSVDNGGRASGELARSSEMSGVRPTEHGGQNAVGTPATGMPLPLDPIEAKGRPAEDVERAGESRTATAPSAASDTDTEWAGRLARALCDRATFCDAVGPGRKHGSRDACIAAERTRTLAEIAELPCDVSVTRQNACLSEIHAAGCDVEIRRDLDRGACSSAALCGN